MALEPHHTVQETDGFPKGVGNIKNRDMVSILVTEEMARNIEYFVLKRNNLHLAGPMIFSDDDVPSYIIGIGEADG